MQTIRPKAQVLKIQRPVFQNKKSKLLIYSEDGIIPVSLVPDEGPMKAALGNRIRARFSYALVAGKIVLGEEIP